MRSEFSFHKKNVSADGGLRPPQNPTLFIYFQYLFLGIEHFYFPFLKTVIFFSGCLNLSANLFIGQIKGFCMKFVNISIL